MSAGKKDPLTLTLSPEGRGNQIEALRRPSPLGGEEGAHSVSDGTVSGIFAAQETLA